MSILINIPTCHWPTCHWPTSHWRFANCDQFLFCSCDYVASVADCVFGMKTLLVRHSSCMLSGCCYLFRCVPIHFWLLRSAFICSLVKLLSDSELLSDSGDLPLSAFCCGDGLFCCCGSESPSDRLIERAIDGATDRQRGRVISGAVKRVTSVQFWLVLYHRIA